MEYKKLYYLFCEKFKTQEICPDRYYEKHHIIPRHQGGDNSPNNLIQVTLRQHVFLHKLRWYAYQQLGDKIAYLWRSGQTEEAARAHVEYLRERRLGCKMPEDLREKLRAIHKERMKDETQISKVRSAQLISAKAKSDRSAAHSAFVVENAERNEVWLHKQSSRSKYRFVSPEGLVFESPIYAANYYGNEVKALTIENWCKRSKYGWKTIPELAKK